jgi:hypothetical protein
MPPFAFLHRSTAYPPRSNATSRAGGSHRQCFITKDITSIAAVRIVNPSKSSDAGAKHRPRAHASLRPSAHRRSLLQSVMLRRSKAAVQEQLGLPPCHQADVLVDLSTGEPAQLIPEAAPCPRVSLRNPSMQHH